MNKKNNLKNNQNCHTLLQLDPVHATDSRLTSFIRRNPTVQQSTRHRASTSMYSLTFRVRVTRPSHYGRKETAHAEGASILSPARGVFAGMRSAWHSVRSAACGGPGGLPLGFATHFHSAAIAIQPVHRLQICPIVHN